LKLLDSWVFLKLWNQLSNRWGALSPFLVFRSWRRRRRRQCRRGTCVPIKTLQTYPTPLIYPKSQSSTCRSFSPQNLWTLSWRRCTAHAKNGVSSRSSSLFPSLSLTNLFYFDMLIFLKQKMFFVKKIFSMMIIFMKNNFWYLAPTKILSQVSLYTYIQFIIKFRL
jgi:hypothetical protein